MAYNQRILDGYRAALRLQHSPTHPSYPSTANTTSVHTTTDEGTTNSNSVREELVSGPFRSRTCPYCNGLRDATPKYIHPSTKPASPRDFWRHVLCDKYRSVQSARARHNLQLRIPITGTSTSSSSSNVVGSMQHGDEVGMSPEATASAVVVGHAVSSTTQPAAHDNNSSGDAGNNNNIIPHAGPHVSDKATYGAEKMFVVGPMVDQSELPFRMLCREYGATLAYTPMLHAKSYRESALYRRRHFTTHSPAEVKAAIQRAQEKEHEQGQVESQKGALHDMCGTTNACTLPRNGNSSDEEEELPLLVDRPCIVQFCGNDPDTVLAAARLAVRGGKEEEEEEVSCDEAYQEEENDDDIDKEDSSRSCRDEQKAEEEKARSEGQQQNNNKTHTRRQSPHKKSVRERYYYCDAVDLNLGCPQGIARRGHYGAFLMEDWELIHTIIHTLHVELEVPVTAKIRVFDQPSTQNTSSNSDDIECADGCGEVNYDEALTIAYARMIRDAGAQLLTVHGRTRAMKGQQTGLANLGLIARIHTALQGSIPVLSNGNVQCYEDVGKALQLSQCEGHMCAEALLWDPTLFAQPTRPIPSKRQGRADRRTRLCALAHAQRYLAWLRRCPVDMGCVKAHLYKMCFHSYELHPTLRDALTRLAMHETDNTITSVREGSGNDNTTNTTGVTSKGVKQGDGEMNGMSTASHQQEQHEQRIMCDVVAADEVTHDRQRVTEKEEEGQQRCVQREDNDEEEEEASVSSSEQLLGPSQLAALEQHLRELYTTELDCDVDLPPVRPAKEKPVDVFAIEESFGIDF